MHEEPTEAAPSGTMTAVESDAAAVHAFDLPRYEFAAHDVHAAADARPSDAE